MGKLRFIYIECAGETRNWDIIPKEYIKENFPRENDTVMYELCFE